MNDVEKFLDEIKSNPETIKFENVIELIDKNYTYTPTCFINGIKGDKVTSRAGENEGSCKIFSFAKIHHLNETQTLHCFGDYYRRDVLQHPGNTDHANIRSFIKHGWDNISFDKITLTLKEG